jgi:glycosyltransferase involved in cell wall biosynthesis
MTDDSTRRPLTVALMLESDEPGGAEIMMLELAEELRRRGHRVHPVLPAKGVGWLGGKFRAAGFAYETFTIRRPLDWRCLRDMVRMLRRLEVDVVHSHEFTMAVYGAAAARLVRRPHVVTMHGNQTMTAVWRRRAALRWAFRRSAATIAVSQATKRSLDGDLGVAPGVVTVIPNGVTPRAGRREAVRQELGMREGELLLLAAGSVVPRKGHMILLQALDELETSGLTVPWRLAIAGWKTGEEPARLEAYAAERGLSHRVHLLGQRSDIPDLLAAADVFVMPSLWEGLPLAVLEAMLAGAPVVASETSGIPEAIVQGEHGLMVPPGDAHALAGALRSVLESPELRARLAVAGRRRAEAEFTIGTMTDRYEALYYRA